MRRERIGAVFLMCAALLGFILLCSGAYLLKERCLTDRTKESEPARIGFADWQDENQGLEAGRTLESMPEEITDTQVIFSDRTLQRISWTRADVSELVESLKDFIGEARESIPSLRAYVMMVPLRIGFEESFGGDGLYRQLVQEERESLDELEEAVLSGVGETAEPVYVNEELGRHQEEYIFFRNSPTWTARGACYGAQELLKCAGLEPIEPESFWKYTQITSELDRQIYYLKEGYNPMVDLVDGEGKERRHPMISATRSGAGVFLDEGWYTTLRGLAENGRNLMIVDGQGGNVLAPWLVGSFEKIDYVKLGYLDPWKTDIMEKMKEEGITDLVLVIGADGCERTDEKPWTAKMLNWLMKVGMEREGGEENGTTAS